MSAVLSADGPSPAPVESPSPAVPSLKDAQEHATNAASWVEQNWSTWLAIGLRVLLILVIAAALRVVVRRGGNTRVKRRGPWGPTRGGDGG
ncbi:mechanosensitive ion channel family protein, partial [Streptomyces sp. NPDC059515]